jgi:hypothetical protein
VLRFESLLAAAFMLAFAAIGSSCVDAATLTQNRKELSSGHIGCSPKEVVVYEEGDRTWAAWCRGKKKKYYCSVTGVAGLEGGEKINCKAEEDEDD